MKLLYSIVSVVIFFLAMFLKVNRAAHIINQDSVKPVYGETTSYRCGPSFSGPGKSSSFSSGIQSNPYAE